ncbi:MAG: M1 family metallopeptidase, partial [Bacteroidales bacterium]
IFISIIFPCFIFFTAGFAGKPGWPVDVMKYEFCLRLNDSTDIIYGETVTEIRFTGLTSQIELDFRNGDQSGRGMKVHAVTLDGCEVQWSHTDNMLRIIPGRSMPVNSTATVRITYSGIPADGLIISNNKYGNRTFFSDHWPDRASYYLPVVDHPSDKAEVDFVIIAPLHYKVVACGYMTEESNLGKDYRLTRWHERVPLPVKVMAFAAGSFATQLAGFAENVPVWSWVYPENRNEGFSDYSVAVKILSFYEKLIGPYPFEKLANVQSKTIFGGLENASCIFYSENSVTGRGRAESLIAHETAHQWFGNSVTEKEWSHIWLSEGFATYLAAVYMEKSYDRERFEEEMKQARERVLRYYDRNPAPVIINVTENLMSLLNANSYQKGAWVLHMLRHEIGEEKFWKGIRLFYEKYRDGNAETSDFRRVMEEVSEENLGQFFHQWLEVPGQPEIALTKHKNGKNGGMGITIVQKQDYLFSFPLDLLIKTDGEKRVVTVNITERETMLNLNADNIDEIIPDPYTWLLFRMAVK